jgi:hypothetical protein
MSDKQIEQFHQHEAENIALSVKFNRWSLVMIQVMIRDKEQKLVAIDLPVEGDSGPDNFWEDLANT